MDINPNLVMLLVLITPVVAPVVWWLVWGVTIKHLLCYVFHRRAWKLTFIRDGWASDWRMECCKCGACHGIGDDDQRSPSGLAPIIKHTITYGESTTPKYKGVTRPGKLVR